jgi:hypothetical protein
MSDASLKWQGPHQRDHGSLVVGWLVFMPDNLRPKDLRLGRLNINIGRCGQTLCSVDSVRSIKPQLLDLKVHP